MERILDLMSGDNNTLYFIGNGFDLFHKGVKSKFIHFYSWLNLKDEEHEKFASNMESIFPQSGIHGNWLWTQFEEALGCFDVNKVHQTFAGKVNDRFYDEAYQKRAADIVHSVLSRIPIYLKEWAKQIDIETVKPVLPLGEESLYLTFNYTLLLERVYGINVNQIQHIHNSIIDDKPLIVGHNKSFPQDYDTEEINIQKSKENLAKEIMVIRKPVEKIVSEHQNFFNSLGNITKVVVFGHSLSDIDIPYFEKVLYNVQDNAKWSFVVYNDDAKVRYQNIVDRYNKYINDPKVFGVSQYKGKIIPQNCNYISINELKPIIAYE